MQKKVRHWILDVLIAVMLAFIWGNSTLSKETSGGMSDTVRVTLNEAAAEVGLPDDTFDCPYDIDGDGFADVDFFIRKGAHMSEFALLALLLWLRLADTVKHPTVTAILLGAAAGGVDETVQIFFHRGPQLRDVGIDSLGAVLGVLFIRVVTALIRRIVENKKRKAADL